MSTAVVTGKTIGLHDEAELQAGSRASRLAVFVIFTSINRTLKALEKAGQLARPLQTGITILVVQKVHYSLPLDEPPVPFEFVIRHFEEMVDRLPENTRISAYVCREPMQALKRVLKHNCPVVMGVRKRWWPTREERLARKLRRAGYDVIVVKME
jgi:hypothetical protein